jgi:hypothetical protein
MVWCWSTLWFYFNVSSIPSKSDAQLINEKATFLWLTEELKQETEIEIIAVQGQALNATYCATEMLETTMIADVKCASKFIKTVGHLIV